MTSEGAEDGPRTLKTVAMASRVIDAVRESRGIGVSELADRLSLSKSTAYIHLKTLEENGFLVKPDDSSTSVVRDDRFREQSPERISRSANIVEVNTEEKVHSQLRYTIVRNTQTTRSRPFGVSVITLPAPFMAPVGPDEYPGRATFPSSITAVFDCTACHRAIDRHWAIAITRLRALATAAIGCHVASLGTVGGVRLFRTNNQAKQTDLWKDGACRSMSQVPLRDADELDDSYDVVREKADLLPAEIMVTDENSSQAD